MTDHNQNNDANAEQENVVNFEETSPEQELNTEPEELSVEEQILALQQEVIDMKDRAMRALAEAENTRRRAQKDREDAGKFAISRFAKDLLDYADNFSRAMESLPEGTPEGVSNGLKAMESDILNVFGRHGVEKIEPMDQPFDANYHEVMFEAPVPGKEAGIIIQVIEPGYVLNDRLLRPAKVGIAKGEDNPGIQVDEQA